MENQNYFEKILNGEMITEEVKTKRGVFTIKNLTSKDHIKIAVEKSKMLQGANLETVDNLSSFLVEEIAVCDTAIVKAPGWWKGAEKCPDDTVLTAIYRGCLSLNKKIQQAMSDEESGKDVGESQL